ncbi:MAG: AarF/ABC1/UbiB kinase family protein, partial [Actinobacteria bacterium]
MASSSRRSLVGLDVAGTASVNTEENSVASEVVWMTIPQGRLRRTAPLAAISARAAGDGVVDVLRRRLKGERGASLEFHVRNAERYADVLSRSKGVLMKAGQILSFVDTSAALASLQADAEPMEPVLVAAVVESELGRPPEEVFADFCPEPIAAASIGQVHAARLHDGTEVAVKVQYPGVADAISDDLANTELLFTFVKIAKGVVPQARNFDVRAVADEIAERIAEEVDYGIELANQMEFAAHYRGHPFARVPEVFPELSSDRVLTMEMVHGRRWTEIDDVDQALRDRWGEVVYRFFFGSVARFGMFNADPHPGNYLFHDDGTVTFLDFGCVKRLSPTAQRGFFDMPAAAIDNDADRLLGVWIEQGFTRAENPPPADKARRSRSRSRRSSCPSSSVTSRAWTRTSCATSPCRATSSSPTASSSGCTRSSARCGRRRTGGPSSRRTSRDSRPPSWDAWRLTSSRQGATHDDLRRAPRGGA